MTQKFQLEQLDEATRDYLRNAKESRAQGLPGVFLEGADGSAMTAFVVGLIIVITTVFVTFPSTELEIRTAMLQTAGFLTGGWLIVCAFRLWAAQSRGKYLGNFWFADPNYFWAIEGSTVKITPMNDIREAKSSEIGSGGKMTLKIHGETAADCTTIPAQDPALGSLFIDFINVVKVIRKDYPDAAEMTPAQLGNNALKTVKAGKFPPTLDRSTGGLMGSLPHPQKVGRASSGFLAMLLIVIVGAGLFYGLNELNGLLRDDAAFANAQESNVLGMRNYLLDDRNRLHRDEAEKQIDAAFEKSIADILAKPEVNKSRAEAFCKILKQIQVSKKNLMAVYVKETPNEQLKGAEYEAAKVTDREKSISERAQNKIIAALEQGLVGMYRADDETHCNVEFSWRFLPPERNTGTRLQWTMTMRDGVLDKPLFSTTEIYRNPTAPNANALLNSCIDEVFTKFLGTVLEIPVINLDDE